MLRTAVISTRRTLDLLATLIRFFKVGLESGEFCAWVLPDPLTSARAVEALRRGVTDADRYLADGAIEIFSRREWYLKGGNFSLQRALRQWEGKLKGALTRGQGG